MNRPVRLADYVPVIGAGEVDLMRRLAERLQKRRVVHVNSTRSGGGVAEILTSLAPLQRDIGLDARWEVIQGGEDFFAVTKSFHNGLQGKATTITPKMYEAWETVNRENRERMNLEADFVVIHDPQPLALIEARIGAAKWIWRCHIDVSEPDKTLWKYLQSWIRRYDAAIFSMHEFAQELPLRELLFHPSIDPLSEKNIFLSDEEIHRTYERLAVPRDRPVVLQVSRFDRFKDPVGVIQAFRIVKRYHRCILVLAGGGATDDPEGAGVLDEARDAAGKDPDIYILALPPADRTINALQRGATVVLQKSVREGFGLTVAEALWKGKPVVGGNAGGIAAQIVPGVTGYLANSVEGAAYWVRYLLEHPEVRIRIGENGREHVRRNFLITRSLRNYLGLFLMLEHQAQGLYHFDTA